LTDWRNFDKRWSANPPRFAAMAKETPSAESSLALYEVLESEFVELHGRLPADYPTSPEPEKRLKAFCDAVHGLKEKRTALCISGGGIRSATFGLGVLQGLARCRLLDKFDYLSTVSGGGYIGSWLSAWIKNDPQGVEGVVAELKRRPDSALDPEPQPIQHLREFSNYLAPRAGLTSVDFWTLIATFIRNMFLNWLVLISLLAAAMMIPRFYLAAVNLGPDWSGQATWYSWKLSAHKLQPNWDAFWAGVKQPWETGLIILLAAGFLLIALAMAYAIIDVPSTGGARSSQRRFLLLRQLPLLLASLILAAWWAVYRNVHGSELFEAGRLLPWFISVTVASYLSGGLIALAVLFIRKRFREDEKEKLGEVEKEELREDAKEELRKSENKERRRRVIGSLSRLAAILVTTALAGLCLWAISTRMFLDEPKKIQFIRDCDGIKIPSEQNVTVKGGTEGTIEKIVDGSYIIQTDQGPARITGKGLEVMERDPTTNLATKFRAKRDRKAILIHTGQKTKVAAGTEGSITETTEEGSYTLNTNQGQVRITREHVDALKPKGSRFTLVRPCNAARILTGENVTLPVGTTGNISQITKTEYIVENGQGEQFRIARKHINAFDLKAVPAPAKHAVTYVSFAPALVLAVLLLVNFLFTGLASWVTDDEDREWWGRSAAWILITMFGWIAINLIVLWGGQAISASPTGNALDVFFGKGGVKAGLVAKTILGAFGGVTGIAGALLALRSKLTKKLGVKIGSQWPLIIAAVVFFVLLAVVISWALLLIGSQSWVQRAARPFGLEVYQTPLFGIFFLTGVNLIFGIVMGFFINANRFSLHALYRNRLIRAYLAASRRERSPNRFTGFDPDDNFELWTLPAEKPLHILNGALNLVKSAQLAWQERQAESFTMSRMHCGCLWFGYRPSADYGKGISLGTALAISGAAANPNMGYHSSPVVGFLMTLFNVRLGWWLGNPGAPGAKTWCRNGPRYSVGPLFSEAFGNTTDTYKYVNLSDGGHFENLGLYEMVLRRCHYIVVSDAGQDPECSFADLGEAVRKIRIDFGIPIEFERMSIYPRSQLDALKETGHYCAIGRIRYSDVDGDAAPDGVIVYIKPACYGNEPRDIYEYLKRNPTFPHETTADQFFSESQFESYRMLGAYTMEKLCADCGGDFRVFIRDILKQHLKMKTPDWLAPLLRKRRRLRYFTKIFLPADSPERYE
jgi:preprotein translocase subunit YajC